MHFERLARTGIVLFFLVSLLAIAPAIAQDVTTDPDQVKLKTDDIRRLAQTLRALKAENETGKISVLKQEYFDQASPGLGVYAERYGVTPETLASALAKHPDAYANLDALADGILAQEEALRSGFRKLQEIYPDAKFPPIWFVAGHHGPGGMVKREGVIIAAEQYSGHPEDVVPIVLHELAHFQQAMMQGMDAYGRIYGPERRLLALALREGSAELIAELTTGRHINPAAESYGLKHEAELWLEFQKAMNDKETGDWMFVKPANADRPQDLGYWMGYRIAKSYYEQASNKNQAILGILGLTDFDAFLKASGYAEQINR